MVAYITRGRFLSLVLIALTGCQAEMSRGPSSLSAARSFSGQTMTMPCGMTLQKYDLLQRKSERVSWKQAYELCPGSAVAAYNYAVELMSAKKLDHARKVINQGLSLHSGFAPLNAIKAKLDSGINKAIQLANTRLLDWIKRPSTLSFDQQVPSKLELPPLPTLVKGEFEPSHAFRQRVEAAKEERAHKIHLVEDKYTRDVSAYNAAVKAYNKALEEEKRDRQNSIPGRRLVFLSESVSDVFGTPRFVDPLYNADEQNFHAKIVSERGDFDQQVIIQVPLQDAPAFKKSIERVVPELTFDYEGSSIHIKDIRAQFGGKSYKAILSDSTYDAVPVSVQLAEAEVPVGQSLDLMQPDQFETTTLLQESSQHFQDALKLEDDPDLARKRQELAELNRKRREAELQKKNEEEKTRLQAQIDRAKQQMASLGGGVAKEFKGLKMITDWKFTPGKSAHKDMVAVVIGNRSYGKGIPSVYYARNDAQAIRQFLEDGYGLPEENILYEENATKGVMEGIFRKRLRNRVTPGKTDVFVYYSGHGMPVGDDARLLPSDARPETADINGYSRDELLQQLASLDAHSLTVVLDACYSGTSKAGQALQETKAILIKPRQLKAPSNAIIISAASGRQTAFMDDQYGQSLMTFYLLEGLSGKADLDHDHKIRSEELASYMGDKVNHRALRLHDQPQNPEVKGTSRVLFEY